MTEVEGTHHGPIQLVLLHPLPFDGGIWGPVLAGLGQLEIEVETVAPTIYALGETLPDVATAVLGQVEGTRLIVVGNSIGGSCALELAAAAPDRVEHLVLIGTKAGHRPEPAYRDWALGLLASDGVEALWEQIWEPLFAGGTDQAIISQARAQALAVPAAALAAGIALFHSRPDRSQVLDEWPKPLTLIVGAEDTAPRPEVSEVMAQRATDAELLVIPDCGHYVPVEQPEALSAILRRVVTSCS